MREINLHKDVKLAISDRFGGVSKKPYESLNLGFHVGDCSNHVEKNREIFASFLNVETKNLYFMEQMHGSDVKVVKNSNDKAMADAIITQNRSLALCVMIADCAPVILYDDKNGAIAAIHAGRKGAFLNIISNTIEAMRENFKTDPKNIRSFIGPSIKSCCYEIKDEVLNKAIKKFAFALEQRGGKWFLSIQKIIKKQLFDNGVTHIINDDICTCCDKNYFSYRRDGICGRFAVGVKLI